MPLSVTNSPGGSGMSNLLRQTRPVKAVDDAASASGGEASAATGRSLGRTAIDSTGAKSAQIKATLTVVLGRLGQGSDPGPERPSAGNPLSSRSAASDLLRVLDAYAADPLRLSA